MKKTIKQGFTLAEILITLTVIGIVAAISLPALMQNVNERAWDAKRKALHVRMTNAILDMPKVKGYGEYKSEKVGDETVVTDTATETFLVDGLSKVYKIKNICDSKHLDKCGMPNRFFNLQGSVVTLPTNMSAFNGYSEFHTDGMSFETENGDKVAIYYNPFCRPYREGETVMYPNTAVCAHMIYDLNGPDEPNKIGKDMGIMSIIYSPKGLEVVAPNPYYKSVGNAPQYSEDGDDAMTLCKKTDPKLTMPTIAEVMSISSLANFTGGAYISSTSYSPGKTGATWGVSCQNNKFKWTELITKTTARPIVCIKE